MFSIKDIKSREILDSRGNPTVEVEIFLNDYDSVIASVPSGASTGKREAFELRDNFPNRYKSKGVKSAVANLEIIKKYLPEKYNIEPYEIDQLLLDIDKSENKSNLGANIILATSLCFAKVAAKTNNLKLFEFLSPKKSDYILPVPMMNIINGGSHADNDVDIQEFMIVPYNAPSFAEAVRWGAEVFSSLREILKQKNLGVNVGDEGGFAPSLLNSDQALDYIMIAIEQAGYRPGEDIGIALDVAASELYSQNKYNFTKARRKYSREQLQDLYSELVNKYPIYSIEDPYGEDDIEGWKLFSQNFNNKIQIVGDDIFVTNAEIFQKHILNEIANTILIKPNQIGTLKETYTTICLAKENGYNTVMSHRSGETADVAISHLAVAYQSLQIKAGSLCRTDRVEKYNELMRIEEYLGSRATFAGKRILI